MVFEYKTKFQYNNKFVFKFYKSNFYQDESIRVDGIKNEFEKLLDETENRILEDAGYKMQDKSKKVDIGTKLQNKANEECKGKLTLKLF